MGGLELLIGLGVLLRGDEGAGVVAVDFAVLGLVVVEVGVVDLVKVFLTGGVVVDGEHLFAYLCLLLLSLLESDDVL